MAFYLVTGGAGFIGSHLVDALLAGGHKVRVLDDLSTGTKDNLPAGVELHIGDVADYAVAAKAMAGVDGCFHLAAIASVPRSNEEWRRTHDVNLTGAINIFDNSRAGADHSPRPVVYASSAAVYGTPAYIPLDEAAPVLPLTAYGADKLGCEQHAYVGWEVHQVPTRGFRFFNIYGPRQHPDNPYAGVVSIFADRLRQGQGIKIFGDGRQTRDFVYVRDVVKILQAAMATPWQGAQVMNIATGNGTTVLQLAESIARICGNTPPAIGWEAARTGDIKMSIGAAPRLREILGITPRISLEEGLAEYLASL
ncbi:MAG: UDP-glucose 4-epimerase [Alphaproteobacteria bacterium]|nr:UDP-glucose 4-epimerase [Alphaproteobacteria bacterium]